MHTRNIPCILGPTASGKSALALEIAKHIPCSIISVDSVKIYKGMDIGSAKPSAELMKAYPHALIDIRDPISYFSVGQFLQEVKIAIDQALANEKLPLLVGGSMMYFNALRNGLASLPSSTKESKTKINDLIKQHGLAYIYNQLKEVDPMLANRLASTDTQRVSRAYEVYLLSGTPLSTLQKATIKISDYDFKFFALMPPRQALHQSIEKRFQFMLKNRLVDEVEALMKQHDLHKGLPSIRSVGYRQVWSYLKGECTYNDMCEKAIIATRQFAKRQYTWMRQWSDLHVLHEYSIQEQAQRITACLA